MRLFRPTYTIFAILALFVVIPSSSSSEPIIGQVSVIDGDTIEIHGQRIRMFGIDAPESDQTCTVNGRQTRCGQQAAQALAGRIGQQTVTCDPRDVDRYGRVVAVCSAGGEDLNAWMVGQGMAVAYRQFSTDYVPQEESAAKAKAGMWQGAFLWPWAWRRGQRELRITLTDCKIKGNINRGGERIFHVPGGQYYRSIKIDTSRGERWFCNDADARKAGWRKSRR
ncbi:MAG: thermonuclease family protein [Alphaproteobacteria bacterium]|nr:thermonuclease family protein [Alphaproteobacteria bacterium]